MQPILAVVDFFLHLDKYLGAAIANYGNLVYSFLFLIIFCETGLVVTPILPGDSLLFAAGAFAALGALKIGWLYLLIIIAAILGDTANYWIGHLLSERVLEGGKIKFIKREYLERSRAFYDKHGAKTIVLARFVPIVRTFAPFLAGVSKMRYSKFFTYNVVGGTLWAGGFLTAGYYFGNLAVVKANFSLVIFAIIILSVLPIAIDIIRNNR